MPIRPDLAPDPNQPSSDTLDINLRKLHELVYLLTNGDASQSPISGETLDIRVRKLNALVYGLLNAASPSSGEKWQPKSANFNAAPSGKYLCNTFSAPFTVTLPGAPSVGDTVDIVDSQGAFDTNNLTIDRNGNKIAGISDNLVCAAENAALTLIYVGEAGPNVGWQIVRSQ